MKNLLCIISLCVTAAAENPGRVTVVFAPGSKNERPPSSVREGVIGYRADRTSHAATYVSAGKDGKVQMRCDGVQPAKQEHPRE